MKSGAKNKETDNREIKKKTRVWGEAVIMKKKRGVQRKKKGKSKGW